MDAISAIKSSPVTSIPLGLGTPQPQVNVQAKAEPSSQPKTTAQTSEQPITENDVKKAIQEVVANLPNSHESIGFNYEEKLGQLYVQVTDSVSGDVIREVPSKDFIKHKLAMQEMIGLLLDKQA